MSTTWRAVSRAKRGASCLLRVLLPALFLLTFIGPVVAAGKDGTAMRVLDDFEDLSKWQVSASDDVRAGIRPASGVGGQALCLDFDFGGVSGYAVVRRDLEIEYPENYEFALALRGEAAPNTLQFKLVDASGENVWWVNRPDFTFHRAWERVRFKRRHITFAWGPAQGARLQRSAALELVIVRGQGGGKGAVCFDELTLRALPAVQPATATPHVTASSSEAGTNPAHAADGVMATVWRSDPRGSREQTLTLDFGALREFGGLVLGWAGEAYAARYAIDYSDDGDQWRTVRQVNAGNGGADPHLLSESETRYVRLRMQDGPADHYALAEIDVKSVEWGASPNHFFHALAKAAPRGHYPRAYVGEQSYWTVLGIDGGTSQGLFSEDGVVEFAPRSPSVEPFLVWDGKLATWADAKVDRTLADGYLPMPSVHWRARDWALRITAFAAGERERAQIIVHYTVENLSDQPRQATLGLAVRPFQVNPPTQFLNVPGGVAPLHELSWDGTALTLNGTAHLYPVEPPDRAIVAPFDAGNIPELIANVHAGSRDSVRDETGFASGALLYRMELPPRGSRRIALVAPLGAADIAAPAATLDSIERMQRETARHWRARLNRTALRLPQELQHVADTLRTALAHVLASRAGPILQPGTRAYARSWIRDGAMMSDALSRLGHAAAAREYIEWFAPHQFSNGKVPCCVDRRGSDPVAENDSHGAFLYLIAQHYRYTGDREWLGRLWPRVAAAQEYMNGLRLKERVPENLVPARRAYYGLMPPSISHEGYSDKPAYSYWDDFWTLAGYDAAIDIAHALGRDADARQFAAQRNEFATDLQASLKASIARHRIDFIPGSADRGDFDATSTTIALSVAGAQSALPQGPIHATFERYWREFLARRENRQWEAYTPYELRSVGAFVRLGWRERIAPLLSFFLGDRRPSSWNQWAEVVGRESREPRFIGDMPHGWVASDYISAVLDQFAYERADDRALVLAAGIPADWPTRGAVGIDKLRTPYGLLTYQLEQRAGTLELAIDDGLKVPPGGFIFMWPYGEPPGRALLNGRPVKWEAGTMLRIRALPARVEIALPRR